MQPTLCRPILPVDPPVSYTCHAITHLAELVVVPRRSLNHYISFDTDTPDRYSMIVPVYWDEDPISDAQLGCGVHCSSSLPREKFPTRSSVTHLPSFVLTSDVPIDLTR